MIVIELFVDTNKINWILLLPTKSNLNITMLKSGNKVLTALECRVIGFKAWCAFYAILVIVKYLIVPIVTLWSGWLIDDLGLGPRQPL